MLRVRVHGVREKKRLPQEKRRKGITNYKKRVPKSIITGNANRHRAAVVESPRRAKIEGEMLPSYG